VNFEWDDDFVVPAGEFVVDFPITIKFDEASATGSFKNYLLLFRLVDSEDFKAVETHRTARMSFMQNR
jgi:hypothetical protein